MHAARLEHSPRLQRTLAYLRDGLWHTTRDIVHGAEVCAVNSCIDELRVGGFDIRCERRGQYWYYRLNQEFATATERTITEPMTRSSVESDLALPCRAISEAPLPNRRSQRRAGDTLSVQLELVA